MRFISTRGQTEPHTFTQAMAVGLPADGGLFLPETLPDFSGRLRTWEGLGYADLCAEFFSVFATDVPPDTLGQLVADSYRRFTDPAIAPLRPLGKNLYLLELYHGPTRAFKDFGLQLLGNLYAWQCAQRGESINIFGATSGDTGAAAIYGMLGRPRTAIFILYPDGRVSPLQERQMACTGAANVFAIAVDGTFDDAQRVLKDIFGDSDFRIRHRLSAVNSINLVRVLAQCVYYLYAWFRLPVSERRKVEFVVPTGNFGNVIAGWLLQKMGVPMHGFKVATNQNDILYRLFTTGTYQVGEVHPSLAPSMDIQVASNFERFLYYQVGRDPAKVRAAMETFKKTGQCVFPNFDRDTFSASRCTDEEITGIIRRVHQSYGIVIDPHTACGFADIDSSRPSVVLATASAAKFPEAIKAAIGIEPTDPSLEALKSRPIVKYRLKAEVGTIRDFIARHAV